MKISRRLWTLLGLLLVPLVVAGGFLWATWDFDSRLERVEAAVVNLDEPVRLDGQLARWAGSWPVSLVEGGSRRRTSAGPSPTTRTRRRPGRRTLRRGGDHPGRLLGPGDLVEREPR
jgi:hypothetical protein